MKRKSWHASLFMTVGLLTIFGVVGSDAEPQSAASAITAQTPAFEVASVKPSPPDSTSEDWDSAGDRVTIKGYSLRKLIKAAYNLKSDAQIVGGPDWLDRRCFDISAKIDDEEMAASNKPGGGRDLEMDIQAMLQNLLRERFNLRVRPTQKEMPLFALIVSGKKSHLALDTEKSRSLSIRSGHLTAVATSTQELADSLSRMREVGNRSVIDRTGLAGRYDFALDWTPDRGAGVPPEASYPGLFTALHEQLGLELKAEKGAVPVIEVLAAEPPIFH